MDRKLKRHDVFEFDFSEFRHAPKLVYKHDWQGGRVVVDKDALTFDLSDEVSWRLTETKPGGWTREVPQNTKLGCPEFLKASWRVFDVVQHPDSQSHDGMWPGAFSVRAENVANTAQTLTFTQTDCYNNCIHPEYIKLVSR